MNIALLIYCSSILCMAFSYPNNEKDKQRAETQSKRDTSYSYVSADINSKEGRVKTITVIKNIDSKNDKAINLSPTYHKNERGGKIHENFEIFGKIPEVPDIDDLFEFTKNYKPIKAKPVEDIKPSPETKHKAKETEKPIAITTEKIAEEISKDEVTEIKNKSIPDDVELINTEMNLKQKSQSLQYVPQPQSSKKVNIKIQLPQSQPQNKYLTEYSTPQHSVRQYFSSSDQDKSAKYKRIPTHVKPTTFENNLPVYSPVSPSNKIPAPSYPNVIVNGQIGGVRSTQPIKPPYLAPNKFKKSQNNSRNKTTNTSTIGYSVSSQAPYLAPSIKKAYDVQISNKNKIVNQTGISNQTNDVAGRYNQTNSIVVPLNLRIGSTIPLGAVTRSRGLRY